MSCGRIPVAVLLIVTSSGAAAGEIAGLPSQSPPFVQRDFEINFSNDFLGRGGSVDDFRTQQFIIAGRIGEDWLALVDHSILTLSSNGEGGRVDQFSGSLGYRLIEETDTQRTTRVTVGGGFRSSGNYGGARMQNGFHNLIGSEIQTLPYVATDRTDGTLWIDAETYRAFHESGAGGFFGSWRTGLWLRGSGLLTSDGQRDSALGAYAVTSRNAIDVWLGVRRDWRNGYDRDPVQIATAAAEADLSIVLGVRFGALMIETVQQTSGQASYGQLKLISSGKQPFPQSASWPRAGFELSFLLPDVQVQLAGKYRSHLLVGNNSLWRESWMIQAQFGEPQFGDNTAIFVSTRQLSAGLELERQLSPDTAWISYYGSLGAGYRREQLLGDNVLAGQTSTQVGRAVAVANGGLRFNAAALSDSWNFRLQLGLSASMPASSADVMLDGTTHRIQGFALDVALGMTFELQ